MKERTYSLPVLLAVVLTVAMVAVVPVMNIPNMAGLCLVVLVLEHYMAPNGRRCYLCVALFSLLSFAILPYAAGFVALAQVWKVALVGGVLFTLLTWLYDSIMERITTGPKAVFAPVISAFGLYLAFQAFAGIIL